MNESPLLKAILQIFLIVVMAIMLATSCKAPDLAAIYEWQIEGGPDDSFNEAQFRIRLPPGGGPVKGIAVVILGDSMCGLHLANDVGWQRWAGEKGYALLALNFTDAGNKKSWAAAEDGSGRALEEGLEVLAGMTREKGLGKAKMLLIGFSTGGQFGYHYALWKPERVAAFITMKGGHHRLPEPGDSTIVPGLLVRGSDDAEYRRKNLEEVHRLGRKQGAPWTLVTEQNADHDSGLTAKLIIPYFEAVLGQTGRTGKENGNGEADSLANWWPNQEFKKTAEEFSRNSKVFTAPALSLESGNLPSRNFIQTDPVDFGTVPWNQGSGWQTAGVVIDGTSLWTRAEFRSVRGFLETDPQQFGPSQKTVRFRVKPRDHQDLGGMKDELILVGFKGDKKLLGAQRISAAFRVKGDLEISPKAKMIRDWIPGKPYQFTIAIESLTEKQWLLDRIETEPKGAGIKAAWNSINDHQVEIVLSAEKEMLPLVNLTLVFASPEMVKIKFPIATLSPASTGQ